MDEVLQTFHMNKSVLAVGSLNDDFNEREYWWSKTPLERLAALEFMRTVNYGYDPATARLQRLLTVAQLGES